MFARCNLAYTHGERGSGGFEFFDRVRGNSTVYPPATNTGSWRSPCRYLGESLVNVLAHMKPGCVYTSTDHPYRYQSKLHWKSARGPPNDNRLWTIAFRHGPFLSDHHHDRHVVLVPTASLWTRVLGTLIRTVACAYISVFLWFPWDKKPFYRLSPRPHDSPPLW